MLKWSAGGGFPDGSASINEARKGPERMMTDANNEISNLAIGRSLRIQSLLSFLLAGGLLLVGQVAAYSSMFGSLAAFIPVLLFALVVTPKIGSDSVTFLRTAVIAEVGKILLTALICVVVFVWVKPLAPGWFFTGMATVLFSGRLGLIFRA
ncbi:MAG: ATP synthase subunit I [Acidiferrobacterales bacterium]